MVRGGLSDFADTQRPILAARQTHGVEAGRIRIEVEAAGRPRQSGTRLRWPDRRDRDPACDRQHFQLRHPPALQVDGGPRVIPDAVPRPCALRAGVFRVLDAGGGA